MKRTKIIALALCVAISLSSSACNSKNNGDKPEIDFWSTYTHEKIVADYDVANYESVRLPAALKVDTAKNDDECAQIIMTAKTDIKSYDVKIDDLKCGDKVYGKENITVYNQKYIELTSITNGQSSVLPTGMWPDALLPFETAKKFQENAIKEGKNQAIVFEFCVPMDTQAGLYTGDFTVTYDGEERSIPVELKVRDVAVSETTHSKSYFSAGWGVGNGELDSSYEVVNRYNQALSKYRLGAGQWLVDETIATFGDGDSINRWIELTWDYIANPKNSTLCLPYRYIEDHTGPNIDQKVSTDVLVAFVKKCIQENVNLVDKLMGYYTMIDEPDMYGSAEHCSQVMQRVNGSIEDAINVISQIDFDANLKSQIIASMQDIEIVVPVGNWNDSIASSGVDTLCPQIQNYDNDQSREKFDNVADGEKWWYTCFGPLTPYASYVLDAPGFFPRIMDWQAEKYGITGNLYWAVSYYRSETTSSGYIEDYYQSAIRCCGINGEGFLFYPGKPYGLTEPVGSIRLQSARDGIEDKELLYALRQGYKSLSEKSGYEFSAQKVLDNLYEQLFEGVQVTASTERFYKIREQMLDLAEAFNSDAKFAVSNIQTNGNDVEFEIVASSDATILNDGTTLSPKGSYGSGDNQVSVYSVKASRLGGTAVNLTVKTESSEREIALQIGGELIETYASEFSSDVEVLYGTSGLNGEGKDSVITVDFDDAEENKTQRMVITGEFLKDIGDKTDYITFKLGKTADDDLKYSICFEFEKSSIYYEIASGTITGKDLNEIKVRNVYSLPWQSGKVKKIHVYFGSQGDTARSVNFGSISVAALG